MSQDCDEFSPEQQVALRARYVVDRIDGKPILQGRARCPHCEVRLRLDPRGTLELEEKGVTATFRLQCPACGRTLSVAERFDWMYSAEELGEWVEPLRELADKADEVYAFMNNNRDDFAPRSAQILRGLLDEHGIEATGGVEPPQTGQLDLFS